MKAVLSARNFNVVGFLLDSCPSSVVSCAKNVSPVMTSRIAWSRG